MKKLITLLLLATLLSCKCYLQQPLTQFIYVDSTCTAIIPDYLPLAIIWDNCDGYTVTQTPPAGASMESSYGVVTIKVIDEFQNADSVVFDIIKVDTIAPTITIDTALWNNWVPPIVDNDSMILVTITGPGNAGSWGFLTNPGKHVVVMNDEQFDKYWEQ